jgi:putative membrane protein
MKTLRAFGLCVAMVSAVAMTACSEKTNPEASAIIVPPEPAAAASGAIIPASTEAPDAATKTFLEDLTHWTMYSTDAGNAALARSKNEAVKAFAQKAVDDSQSLSKELEPLATSAGIMPPVARDADVMAKLDALTNATATTFDATYISQQEAELTAAHDRDKAYVETGANDTIKAFAQKRADRVTAQLAALATLKKTVK